MYPSSPKVFELVICPVYDTYPIETPTLRSISLEIHRVAGPFTAHIFQALTYSLPRLGDLIISGEGLDDDLC